MKIKTINVQRKDKIMQLSFNRLLDSNLVHTLRHKGEGGLTTRKVIERECRQTKFVYECLYILVIYYCLMLDIINIFMYEYQLTRNRQCSPIGPI